MAKEKENPQAEYLKLASEVVNTMKVLLDPQKELNEDQKKLLENIPDQQNKISFQNEKELKDFIEKMPNSLKEVDVKTLSTNQDPTDKKLNLLNQSLLKCVEQDVATARLLINQYTNFTKNQSSKKEELGDELSWNLEQEDYPNNSLNTKVTNSSSKQVINDTKKQKIHKIIKRAFKSAKEKVKNIGSAISDKAIEFKASTKEKGGKLKEKGSEWKDRVTNKINTWRGR